MATNKSGPVETNMSGRRVVHLNQYKVLFFHQHVTDLHSSAPMISLLLSARTQTHINSVFFVLYILFFTIYSRYCVRVTNSTQFTVFLTGSNQDRFFYQQCWRKRNFLFILFILMYLRS